MDISTACELIGNLAYKPGWSFKPEPHEDRFEGSVKLTVQYPAAMSELAEAKQGYPDTFVAHVSFTLPVKDCQEPTELYRRVLKVISCIDEHEAREFLRVTPTFWSPFHPHRIDGMTRWGDMRTDYTFGLS